MAELGAMELSQMTRDLDDTKKMIFQTQYSSEKKDRGTAVILAIFLYDRLWLGNRFGNSKIYYRWGLWDLGSHRHFYSQFSCRRLQSP